MCKDIMCSPVDLFIGSRWKIYTHLNYRYNKNWLVLAVSLAPSPVMPLGNKNNYIIKKLCNGLMVVPANEESNWHSHQRLRAVIQQSSLIIVTYILSSVLHFIPSFSLLPESRCVCSHNLQLGSDLSEGRRRAAQQVFLSASQQTHTGLK